MQLGRVINCAWDGSLARSNVVPRLFLVEGRIDVSQSHVRSAVYEASTNCMLVFAPHRERLRGAAAR